MSNADTTLALRMRRDWIGIDVLTHANGTHTVHWTDYVANEWDKDFDTLSAALAWMAFLIRCEESDWNMFAGNGIFADQAERFFEEVSQ